MGNIYPIFFKCTPGPNYDPIGQKTHTTKKILGKAFGKAMLKIMDIAVNYPDSARPRCSAKHPSIQRFSFQFFSFSQITLTPAIPLFPPPVRSKAFTPKAIS